MRRQWRAGRALAEVSDLAMSPDVDSTQLHRLARVYTLAAGKEEANRDRHVGDALQLLRRAVAKGLKDAEQLLQDNDLKPLHDHEDFRKLLAELEGKSRTQE